MQDEGGWIRKEGRSVIPQIPESPIFLSFEGFELSTVFWVSCLSCLRLTHCSETDCRVKGGFFLDVPTKRTLQLCFKKPLVVPLDRKQKFLEPGDKM